MVSQTKNKHKMSNNLMDIKLTKQRKGKICVGLTLAKQMSFLNHINANDNCIQ